jgi:hypothetical protein
VKAKLEIQDAKKKAKKKKGPPAVKLEYFLKARGGGYYNVEDSNGKVINEKALRRKAADELIETLEE